MQQRFNKNQKHKGLKNFSLLCTHITDNMQRSAAGKIERGFGRNEGTLGEDGQTPDQAPETPVRAEFEPKQPKIRRPGAGCIFRIGEKKWEGSYSPELPDGYFLNIR